MDGNTAFNPDSLNGMYEDKEDKRVWKVSYYCNNHGFPTYYLETVDRRVSKLISQSSLESNYERIKHGKES